MIASSAPAGAVLNCASTSTGFAAAPLHPWLHSIAPPGRGDRDSRGCSDNSSTRVLGAQLRRSSGPSREGPISSREGSHPSGEGPQYSGEGREHSGEGLWYSREQAYLGTRNIHLRIARFPLRRSTDHLDKSKLHLDIGNVHLCRSR